MVNYDLDFEKVDALVVNPTVQREYERLLEEGNGFWRIAHFYAFKYGFPIAIAVYMNKRLEEANG